MKRLFNTRFKLVGAAVAVTAMMSGCAVYGPPPGYAQGPYYGQGQYGGPVYAQPAPVYAQPAPVYYGPPPVSLGLNFGFWGGGYGHRHYH